MTQQTSWKLALATRRRAPDRDGHGITLPEGGRTLWLARVLTAAALAGSLTARAAAVPAEEQCEGEEFLGPRATLVLKQAGTDSLGRLTGTFELHNYDLGPGVDLTGMFEPASAGRRMLVLSPQDTRIEFRDLNRTWTVLARPMTAQSSTERLVVRPGTSVLVRAYLFDQKVVRHDGAAFRLKMYTRSPRQCVVSLPFSAVPARARVTGFVSVPSRSVAPSK